LVDSIRHKEWFEMAKKDLQSAEMLFEHDADNGIVCFHCQQAIVERQTEIRLNCKLSSAISNNVTSH
jgi:hypothetical protein